MKRKIFNVLLVLVMVLSFSLVTAAVSFTMIAAVPATPAVATALPVTLNVIPFSLATDASGVAAWTSAQYHSGSSSANLTAPATADYARVKVALNTAFSSFAAPSLYYKIGAGAVATTENISATWPIYERSGHTVSTGYLSPYPVIYITNGTTPHYIIGQPWAESTKVDWTLWNNATASNITTQALWHNEAFDDPGMGGSVPAGWGSLSYWETTYTGYTVIGIGVGLGSFAVTGQQQAYVDDVTAGGTTYDLEGTSADYSTIQAAINAASTGDTINVTAGMHIENVTVDKSVTLHGASSATVTVSAADVNAHVFNVSADSVTISGFTVSGAADPYAGIYLGPDVTLCNIHDNILTNNFDGIFLDIGSNHNTLTSNTASSNTRQGFEIIQSDYNTFTSNTANSNTKYGFKMESASHNTFTSNTANSNSQDGFRLTTGSNEGATGCNYNTFTSNTVNSNTGNGFNMLGRVAGDSNNNVLTNNTISSNAIGISIGDAFVDASTMTVNHNIIAGNTSYGISNSGTDTLDATANWWGAAAGPYIETNPYYRWTGSGYIYTDGDHVSTNVEYIPWLIHKDLAAGWNIFSTPITSGTSTDTIAEALNLWTSDSAKVLNAYYFNAATQHWLVATDLTPLVPVYLNLSSAATIDVLMSTDYSSPPAKTMYLGWNLIGPAQLYAMDVDDALVSAYYGTGESSPVGYSQVVSPGIHQLNWTFLRRHMTGTTEYAVLPTEGYWVYMVNQGTLGGFTYTPITEGPEA